MDERFRKLYIAEARGEIEEVNASVLALQKDPARTDALQALYGSVHTLKSTSLEMGFDRLGDLLHSIEEILSGVQKEQFTFNESLQDVLFDLLTYLDGFLDLVEKGREQDASPEELVAQVSSLKMKSGQSRAKRMSIQADPTGMALYSKKISQIRMDVGRLDKMVNLAGEMVIAKIKLAAHIRRYSQDPGLAEGIKVFDRLLQELQTHVLQARLIPLEHVLNRFPRLVRDISRAREKDVNLSVQGNEIELDRTILDGLAEPLVHLVKNAVDHGIEAPVERKRAGKQPIANLTITARRQRSYCVVEITDDGRGIHPEEILAHAGEAVPERDEEAMTAALRLIMSPGFSTAKKVTEISGRGVGLAFVKQRVETLGGRVRVRSVPGEGTTFEIRLPLTMAIIQSLLVEDSTGRYVLPLSYVAGAVEIPKRSVYEVKKEPVIDYRGQTIRLLGLNALLNQDHGCRWYKEMEQDALLHVIVLKEIKATGLVVRKLLGRQEVVVKPLDRLTSRFPFFSGATILEDGQAAFILDVAGLHH